MAKPVYLVAAKNLVSKEFERESFPFFPLRLFEKVEKLCEKEERISKEIRIKDYFEK